MKPHSANLRHAKTGRNTLSFEPGPCHVCDENLRLLDQQTSFQLFSHFHRMPPSKLHAVPVCPPTAIDLHDGIQYAVPVDLGEAAENHRKKLAKVLEELKVHELPFAAEMKHRLVAMIDRNLDPFGENDDDLGHTTAIEHAINTGDAAPIRQ